MEVENETVDQERESALTSEYERLNESLKNASTEIERNAITQNLNEIRIALLEAKTQFKE